MTGAASVVHGKRFTSGRQLKEYTKQLMQEVGSTDDLKAANLTAFRFLWDLFQRHPRPQVKKLESVCRVAIGPSEQDGRLTMWLVYADGSPLAISVRACCSPKQKRHQEERAEMDGWRPRLSPKLPGPASADDVQ
jgi:hypothetical protein